MVTTLQFSKGRGSQTRPWFSFSSNFHFITHFFKLDLLISSVVFLVFLKLVSALFRTKSLEIEFFSSTLIGLRHFNHVCFIYKLYFPYKLSVTLLYSFPRSPPSSGICTHMNALIYFLRLESLL